MPTTPIIACADLSFSYPQRDILALQHISLTVEPGEFVLLCGATGSGKTTLLRHFKPELTPHGARSGQVHIHGQPELSPIDSARIGFVGQNPETQLVTDTVWHEMAFGLENLGLPTETIRRRVGETAHFFDIQHWFARPVHTLSGGQKQTLCLAAVLAMQPSLLLLDEPTARLDPIAADEFISLLQRIHRELGCTLILSEHRLGRMLSACSRVIQLDHGRMVLDGAPQAFAQQAVRGPFAGALSPATRLAARFDADSLPLTIEQARAWLRKFGPARIGIRQPSMVAASAAKPTVQATDIWFRYPQQQEQALSGWSLSVAKGEFHCVVGGNGSGKSTALGVLAGIHRPQRGRVRLQKGLRTALLMQEPAAMFITDRIRDDLALPAQDRPIYQKWIDTLQLHAMLDCHPHDLSGGELQRAALAKLLISNPDILLLDEPIKGLDAPAREHMGQLLRMLSDQGRSIVLITHDLEFAARYADRCSMMFQGETLSADGSHAFFADNLFYTTDLARMTRGLTPTRLITEDMLCDAP